MPTATETRPVIFVSPCPNLYLNMRPALHEKRDVSGAVITPGSTGAHVQFEQGRAEITEAVETETVTNRDENGEQVAEEIEVRKTFVNGDEVDVPFEKLIAWLRSHRLLNRVSDDPANGFWEEGASPDEPEPTTADQLRAIVQAVSTKDPEALAQVLKLEEDTHKRPAILAATRDAQATLAEAGKPEGSGSPDED